MIKRVNIKEKRERIIDFIKKNPTTTYREVKRVTGLHPNKYFNGLSEAFSLAKVREPRTLTRKTKKERQKIIIDYLKKNPESGQNKIIEETGVKIQGTFKNIRDAHKEAGVPYLREISYNRSVAEKREEVISAFRRNPYISLDKAGRDLQIKNIFKLFKNIDEIYELVGIKKINRGQKRRYRKMNMVVNYIRKNPLATQRDINRKCKTHVQELYKNGIFDAYKEAGVEFPFERLKQYGIGLKKVRKRAKSFEDEIAIKLSGFGTINRLVKTKRGFADIILERKDKKVIIEVKDYQNKDISISQIKQLNKYLEDTKINVGILICHRKPKKDKFIIGENKIVILEEQEIKNLPSILEDL